MTCRVIYILASWMLVMVSSNTDEETSPTGLQRQFIGSRGFGQNAFSQTPFPTPFNGMNPIGGMNEPQLNTNQLQLLAAMQKYPRMRQQIAGLLQPQMGGGGGGIGQPFGEANEENTLMHNPITAPDGLTKDVLKSLMFGNVGEISPPYGNGMGYPPNNMMNSFTNGPSRLPAPRNLGSLINSFENHQAGYPAFPKFNFGGQDQSRESSMLQSRHHHKRHGHLKKRKSDTVTKLLLSLLVDKLKDIYEIDKFNTTTLTRKENLHNLETTGKIGDNLHSAGNQGNNQTHEAPPPQRDQQKKGDFQTNLSFPLTVSDENSTGVHLIDSIKKGSKKRIDNFQLDSASINTIIKDIEANKTLKLSPVLSKSVAQTGVNRELKDLKNIDNANVGTLPLGSNTAEKITKILGEEDFVKNPDTGSFSEFHTIQMPLKSADQNDTILSSVAPAVKLEDIKKMAPLDGSGVEQITSLPSFSVSSFLNRGESQSVTATDRVLSPNAQSSQANSSSTELEFPKDLSTKPKDTTSVPGKSEYDNYLEASRVLGSVYNKVKDPLAKKSVETAIKAMLKLIESDSSYSKKGNVPSLASVKRATDHQREDSGLQRSFNEFVRKQNASVVKKARRVKMGWSALKHKTNSAREENDRV